MSKSRLGKKIGEQNGNSKFNNNELIKIYELFKDGKRIFEITKKYNVPNATIWYIVHKSKFLEVNNVTV